MLLAQRLARRPVLCEPVAGLAKLGQTGTGPPKSASSLKFEPEAPVIVEIRALRAPMPDQQKLNDIRSPDFGHSRHDFLQRTPGADPLDAPKSVPNEVGSIACPSDQCNVRQSSRHESSYQPGARSPPKQISDYLDSTLRVCDWSLQARRFRPRKDSVDICDDGAP